MSRTGGIILGIVVVIAVIFGIYMVDFDVEDPGAMPDVDVSVEGGEMPDVDADVGDVTVGTTEETVTVPDVDVTVGEEETQVDVPVIDVDPPADDAEEETQ